MTAVADKALSRKNHNVEHCFASDTIFGATGFPAHQASFDLHAKQTCHFSLSLGSMQSQHRHMALQGRQSHPLS
ncbi:MAG: hypothetical protein RSD05_10520 [Comamonas sp.]